MRAVVQRVRCAEVRVEGVRRADISKGILVFVGVEQGDGRGDVEYIASKVLGLRIFEDETGRMNLSVRDINGDVLVVSQFTLLGDARKGRRPSFDRAEPPQSAREIYAGLVEHLKEEWHLVKEGEFQAHMEVFIVNDGPVTILLDSRKTF